MASNDKLGITPERLACQTFIVLQPRTHEPITGRGRIPNQSSSASVPRSTFTHFFVLHKYSFITVNKRSLKIGIRVVSKKMKSKKKCSVANLNIIKFKINRILSDIKFVNSFVFYSKIIQKSKTEMYVHGHEFQVGIHIDIVRER